MKKLLLFLLLLGLAGADSMFDLPQGTWEGENPYRLEIGPPETRSFQLTSGPTRIVGTYKVTATKGDAHIRWQIAEAGPGEAKLGELVVRPGDTLRGLITWGENQDITGFRRRDPAGPDRAPFQALTSPRQCCRRRADLLEC